MVNGEIGIITLDLDYYYEQFIKVNSGDAINEIKKRIHEIDYDDLQIRKSATGRTHIKIFLKKPVDLFEYFLIRAYLGDDRYRIVCDLSRYYKYRTADAYGRLFDEKIKDGKHKTAGQWLDLGVEKLTEIDRRIQEVLK